MKESRHKQGTSNPQSRDKQGTSKAQATHNQGTSKGQTSRKLLEKINERIYYRMKWLSFNKAIVYICNELETNSSYVTTEKLMKNLNVSYDVSYRILKDLITFGFLDRNIKSSFNSYKGVRNSDNLKLERFKELAESKIENYIKKPKRKKWKQRK